MPYFGESVGEQTASSRNVLYKMFTSPNPYSELCFELLLVLLERPTGLYITCFDRAPGVQVSWYIKSPWLTLYCIRLNLLEHEDKANMNVTVLVSKDEKRRMRELKSVCVLYTLAHLTKACVCNGSLTELLFHLPESCRSEKATSSP